MKHTLLATLLGLSSFVAQPVQATLADAKGEAVALAIIAMAAGFKVEDQFSAHYLRLGEIDAVKTVLQKGRTYKIILGGCRDAYDVNLAVIDENRNVIGQDTDDAKHAVVEVTPRWTGVFYILIGMARGTPDGAHFTQITAYK